MSENIIEKAIIFATLAHAGQVRKGEKDKPMIIHPLAVAQTLIEYGADNNVIVAGILHDVWEDTKYSLDDIREKFGEDVAHLVCVASEPDKSKSWEERKQHTITSVKQLSLREKLVPLADKINNIESLDRIFKQKGSKDFSAFKRGQSEQEWYYRNIYESLIYHEDEENPLFKRLEESINSVFGRTMEEYKDFLREELENILMESDITKINDKKESIFRIIPELKDTDGFDQKNPYHIYDVWGHIAKAVEQSEEDLETRLALLLHDIGKPHSCQEDGEVRHFKGHAEKSAQMAQEILTRLGYEESQIDNICFLIENHAKTIDTKSVNENNLHMAKKLLNIQYYDAFAYNPEYIKPVLQKLDKVGKQLEGIEKGER